MRLDVGAVDGRCLTRPSGFGQGGQHRSPEAAMGPPIEAVVHRGARAVLRWTIAPAAARGEHMQDARDDQPVVFALGAGLVLRHEWFNHRPLLFRQPKQVRRRHLPDQNHRLE